MQGLKNKKDLLKGVFFLSQHYITGTRRKAIPIL